MKREEIKEYDFSDDIMKPDFVLQHLRAHDERMDDEQPYMSQAKSAYATRFWQHISGQETSNLNYELSAIDQVEVNRLKPALTGYLASLYPRRMKTVIAGSPYTTGDAKKASLLINDWLNQPLMRQRLMLASRQALLYKGAGAKIGYDPAGEGLDRVWMRVFPYWEMILDADVHDWEDARYIGHVSFRPKEEVAEEYGLPDDIGGRSRDDFLDSFSKGRSDDDEASSDAQGFIRVLEFCNLVDDFYDTNGVKYKGRLEIYVIDQNYNDGKALPVYMGPLPLVSPRGKPMAHIVPLIFDYEPEYPYRGIAYSEQLMPQQRELNAMRSYMSSAARRDSRMYLARKGVLDEDAWADLKSGEDGLIIEVDEMFSGDLRQVLQPIVHGPVSSNILQTMQMAELDLERNMVQSPAALGQVTKATAAEVMAVESHTQSEFGRHAESRDLWLLQLVQRALAAHVAAMYDSGDSEGAEEHVDEFGIEKGEGLLSEEREEKGLEEEKPEEQPDEEPQEEPSELPEEPPEEQPEEGQEEQEEQPDEEPDEDEEDFFGADEEDAGEPTAEPEREVKEIERQVQRTIFLLTAEGEEVEVYPEDIDSDFDIGFSEAGRSPTGDAELKQNLVVLSDKFLQLMELHSKGGPMGIMAEELWRSLHERFEFPANLGPDYIKGKIRDLEEEEAMKAPAPGPEPGMEEAEPPPEEGGAPPAEGGGKIEEMVERIRQLPPEDGLAVLEQMLGENPEAAQAIQEIRQMPPEQQPQAIEGILNAILEQAG